MGYVVITGIGRGVLTGLRWRINMTRILYLAGASTRRDISVSHWKPCQ